MPASHSTQPAQPAKRRTRVPPAITRGAEPMPGLEVLEEVRGPLGVVLWKCVRNVTAWASTPASRRGGLFAGSAAGVRAAELEGIELDAELVAPLSVLQRLLESPGAMDTARLVNACRRVSLWAEQRGHLGTALEFMQAAAQTAPQSAALAYSVGRLARRRAEYDRAESWYARAIVQARRTRDWRAYARAYSGLGNLFMQRGSFPASKRAHTRCLVAARRYSLPDLEGDALHDLFGIAFETGAEDEACTLGVEALESYGRGSVKTLRLAYDSAYMWAGRGNFVDALRVATAILPHMNDQEERLVVYGLVARAAGGSGNVDAYEAAAGETWEMVRSGNAGEAAARALLGLAHGAASLGRWEEAAEALETTIRHANERRESRIVLTAEAMLESVRGERRTQEASAAAGGTGSVDLAGRLVDALTLVGSPA